MPPDPGLSEADLEMLDAFPMSDQAPENCMQLSDLDGFLTAVVIDPELMMPNEWLPMFWGGGAPEFETIGQAQRIVIGKHGGARRDVPRRPAATIPARAVPAANTNAALASAELMIAATPSLSS